MSVYAMSPIPPGTYIARYLGELITKEEEEQRQNEAKDKALSEEHKKGNFSYRSELAATQRVVYNFDLSSTYKPGSHTNTDSTDIVIDAMNYGNLGRYFNHRCKYPNLFMQRIIVNQTPYMALFVQPASMIKS